MTERDQYDKEVEQLLPCDSKLLCPGVYNGHSALCPAQHRPAIAARLRKDGGEIAQWREGVLSIIEALGAQRPAIISLTAVREFAAPLRAALAEKEKALAQAQGEVERLHVVLVERDGMIGQEQAAHDQIARLCFAAGASSADGTSVAAVKDLCQQLARLQADNDEYTSIIVEANRIENRLRAELAQLAEKERENERLENDNFELEEDLVEARQRLNQAQAETVRTELNRRRGDPITRLHNICEALQDDLKESPFSREEWNRMDAEHVRLEKECRELRAQIAQRETELAAVWHFSTCPYDHCERCINEETIIKQIRNRLA